ncbi:MAG: gamma-glutamylcyclotransferase [Prolixibacteraceae bacterium]|nr:gamma-glutamylcyclotransferase [Prolixibacteraceae bacterium]
MVNLFVYGTLMFPEIVKRLTGKSFISEPAVLKGFRRYSVKGCDYPAIVKEAGFEINGLLLLQVEDKSLQIITDFEEHQFKIKKITVICGNKNVDAVTFIWNDDPNLLKNKDWNINNFRNNYLSSYL